MESFVMEGVIEISFDYEPEQKEIIHPVDNSQPGFPPQVYITSVEVAGQDVLETLEQEAIEQIEKECLKHVKIINRRR